MAVFVNTVDIVGDETLIDSILDRSIAGSFNDNNVNKVGSLAFAYCKNLESVCFPNAVSIGAGAFRGSGLKAITPETFPLVTKIDYHYNSRVFGESALESIEWPSLTTNYEDGLFADCVSLKRVSLPNITVSGLSYSNLDFGGCTALTDVELPLLADKCPGFSGCTSLETITLPLVTGIDGGAFNNCTSLRIVDLSSCTSMTGHSQFINCPLDALILRSETMCVLSIYTSDVNSGYYSFRNTNIAKGTGLIYVPRALVDSYKSATNWSVYADQIRAIEDYTVDGTVTGKIVMNYVKRNFRGIVCSNTDRYTGTSFYATLTAYSGYSIDDAEISVTMGGVDVTNSVYSNGVINIPEVTGDIAITAILDIANILLDVPLIRGYYINETTGAYMVSSGDAYTDKFEVSGLVGSQIKVAIEGITNTSNQMNYNHIHYYDANDKHLGRTTGTNGTNVITSTVPSNAVYARVSVNTTKGFTGITITDSTGKVIGEASYT